MTSGVAQESGENLGIHRGLLSYTVTPRNRTQTTNQNLNAVGKSPGNSLVDQFYGELGAVELWSSNSFRVQNTSFVQFGSHGLLTKLCAKSLVTSLAEFSTVNSPNWLVSGHHFIWKSDWWTV